MPKKQMLIRDHTELVALWQRLHRAEAAGLEAQAVRRRLETPLISAAEAADLALQQPFRGRLEGAEPAAAGSLEQQWQARSQTLRREAKLLLTQMGA